MSITHTFDCLIADDAAAAAAGEVLPSHWNDGHAIDSIQITGGTVTASTPLIDATQTWNNGAVTFTGWKLNVTNTASASASKLLDLQVGGTPLAWVTSLGAVVVTSPSDTNKAFRLDAASGGGVRLEYAGNLESRLSSSGLDLRSNGIVAWSNSAGQADNAPFTYLWRGEAAGIIEQQNSTNAQTFRVYGTYTDSSNYVRASLASSSTAVTLAAETAGTGADNVPVNLTPAGTEGVVIGNFAQFTEMTAPAAGAANTARLFCEDNGSGKTRLMVQFASGAAQQIAIEP